MDGHLEKGKNMLKMRHKVTKDEVTFVWTEEWRDCACRMYACKQDYNLIRDYVNHEISRLNEQKSTHTTFVTVSDIKEVILQAEKDTEKSLEPHRPIHHVVQKMVLAKDARYNVISLPFVVKTDKKSSLRETFV